jgi:calmodulin
MAEEVEETFSMVQENGNIPAYKVELALKSLGMTPMTEDARTALSEMGDDVDLEMFCKLVCLSMQSPNWAHNEMIEAYRMFDKDGNGYIDPSELRRVFTKIGEHLDITEVEDQLREFDIDGDLQMVQAEFNKMIYLTKGSDFVFNDS